MADDIELIQEEQNNNDIADFPIFADMDMQKEVISFLQSEMDDAEAEREEKLEVWKDWRRIREAYPRTKHKNFPIENASNITVPLTSWISNTIFGKLESTFNQIHPFWTVKNLRTDSEIEKERAKVLTRYLGILAESPTDLNLKAIKQIINYEVATMGTCFIKVPWTETPWQFKRYDENGNIETVQAESHIGPQIVVLELEDVLYREGLQDIQRATWIAVRSTLTEYELKERQALGVYKFVDDILDWKEEIKEKNVNSTEAYEGVEPLDDDLYEIWEVYLKWDVDNDGLAEDLFLTFHRESGTILQAEFNDIGIRVINNMVYLLRPHQLTGRGSAQLTYHMQAELDTTHNIRMDSTKLAAVRMLAVRKQSGLKTNEKIYSGRVWFLDDPKNDIAPIQMGEVYPSSIESENMAVLYAQKNAGIPDIMSGFPDMVAKSRASVGGQMMQLQQGTGIFSSIAEALKNAWSRVGQYILFQLISHRERVIERERRIGRLSPGEIETLNDALQIPIEEVPSRLALTVQTTDVEQTFEAQRQNILTLVQLFNMYIQQTLPLVMQLYNPNNQLPPDIQAHFGRIFVGQSKLMYKIFKLFGEETPEDYIPSFERLEKLLDIRDMMLKMMDNTVGGLNDRYEQIRELAESGTGLPRSTTGSSAGAPQQRRVESGPTAPSAATGNIPEQNGVF